MLYMYIYIYIIQQLGTSAPRTLFTKAAPDGVSLGDCPFSHAVQIALRLGSVGGFPGDLRSHRGHPQKPSGGSL